MVVLKVESRDLICQKENVQRTKRSFHSFIFFIPHSENSQCTYCGAGSDWSGENQNKELRTLLREALQLARDVSELMHIRTNGLRVTRGSARREVRRASSRWGSPRLQLRPDDVNSHRSKARKGISHNLIIAYIFQPIFAQLEGIS